MYILLAAGFAGYADAYPAYPVATPLSKRLEHSGLYTILLNCNAVCGDWKTYAMQLSNRTY